MGDDTSFRDDMDTFDDTGLFAKVHVESKYFSEPTLPGPRCKEDRSDFILVKAVKVAPSNYGL